MLYAVRWEVNIDSFTNIVQLTGIPINLRQE